MISARFLATLRMAVGIFLLYAPAFSAKLFLLTQSQPPASNSNSNSDSDPDSNSALSIVIRLAGSRDLAIGILTLYAARQAEDLLRSRNDIRQDDSTSTGTGTGYGSGIITHPTQTTPLLRRGGRGGRGGGGAWGIGGIIGPVLTTNIAIDAMDIFSCAMSLGEGNLDMEPALVIGGGSLFLFCLGVYSAKA